MIIDDYSGYPRRGKVFRNTYAGKKPSELDTYYVDDLGFSNTGGGSEPQRPRDAAQDTVAIIQMGARGAEALEEEFHAGRQRRWDEKMALRDKWKTGQDQRDADRERMALIANQSVMGNNAFASVIGR